MATSGSSNFSMSRDDIIKYAVMLTGNLSEGGTPTTAQTTDCAMYLNMIVKAREADGMPLWATKQGYLLPTTGTSTMTLGGSDNAVSDYSVTTTSAAALSGASTIVVTSATGISSGYAIGIELSDSTMQWTTVNGAPSGTTVTLTATLTQSVASGAQVYCYSTSNRIMRPLRITSAYNINYGSVSTPTRYPINIVSRDQWFSLGGPTNASVPNQIYYDTGLTGTGTVYIYPRFLTGDNIIQITYQKPYDDFDASGDTPDFPQEWYMAITYELAAMLGARYGVPIAERKLLFAEASYYRELALSNGTEQGSLMLQPDWRYFDLNSGKGGG